MATYKVIQDIEAEDKILGPLTLRQFIYTIITCFLLYLCFVAVKQNVIPLLIFLIPPTLFTAFFALPFGRDQPTEVWAVAKIGFLFKPRKRVWNQSGVKELVTINVPKKIERVYTNGLSQTEVKSRLSALANTIDSRGWAIKNVNVNLYSEPGLITNSSSDRLIDVSNMPQAVPDYTVYASDDMLDENNNPIAQQFAHMIDASTQAHRQHIIDTMNDVAQPVAAPAKDSWFAPREPQVLEPASAFAPVAVTPATPTAEELALLNKIKAENHTPYATYNSHMHTLQPLSAQRTQAEAVVAEPVTPPAVEVEQTIDSHVPQADPHLQYLARSNDRSIESLGREAKKTKENELMSGGEVVISLR